MIIKKLLVLLSVLVLVPKALQAADIEVNGLFYNLNVKSMTAEVTFRDGYDSSNSNDINYSQEKITIPAKINVNNQEYTVTRISGDAFSNCSNLQTVTIDAPITYIGYSAFRNCTKLTYINIPEEVTKISVSGFYNCSSLTELKLPSGLTEISSFAFTDCSQLASINIPEGLTKIENNCFLRCSSLTELILPSGVTEIEESAFEGCSRLASINIPDGVTAIPYDCFSGCSSLTELTLPSGVTAIGWSAFDGCSQLASINIPDGVTAIPYGCFSGCSSLTELKLPAGVTEIGEYAFNGCSQLVSINIPDGVTKIPDNCFNKCSSLTELKLPSGLTEMGEYAFNDCSQLASINIPDGVTNIPDHCFYNCSSLTELKLPTGVTEIGSTAFSYCGQLASINIPDGVTEIGMSAFSGCSQLTSINIPEGVTKIPVYCFFNCSSLTELKLPTGVTEIERDAFYGCSHLASINIPDGVKTIPQSCFYNCSSLTELTLPTGVTEIGMSAFSGCSQLEQLTSLNPIPPTLDSSALPGPSSLKTVYVPFGAKAAYEAAEGWKNYNIVELPATLIGTLKVQDFAIKASETRQVNLNFDGQLNANLYSGFQFDFSLPQGIAVSSIELNEDLQALGFNLRTTSTDNKNIRVVSANLTGKTSDLTEGILTLTVTAAPDAPNGDSQITLTKVSFSSPEGRDIFLDDSNSTVTINNVPVSGFTITPSDEEEIYVNQIVSFSATVTPEDATNKNFTWTLDEESEGIVEIVANENGEITVKGLKLGEATLTVTADDYMGVTATATVKVIPTPAQSVMISAADMMLLVGTTGELTATVNPEDTTDKTITWSSENEATAMVSEDGLVTAVAPGTVIIKATCGEVSGTCEVTVKAIEDITVQPGNGEGGDDDGDDNTSEGDENKTPGENTENGMSVSGSDITLRVGQKGSITLDIEPGVDYDPQLLWTLAAGGDSYVKMTVNEENTLTASFEGLSVGQTTYTVSTPANGASIITGKINVIATNPVMSLSVSPEELSLAQNAPAYQLTTTISPENVTIPTLSWTSSDSGIATVDNQGNVTPVAKGSCDITVSTTDGTGLTAVCHVTITAPVDDNFEFEFDESVMGGAGEISIYLDATYQFKPKAQDGYVLPDNITWSSSAPEVVSVDDDGTIHGLQLGDATVTASATVNGREVKATCKVNVIPIPALSISIDGGGVKSIKQKETLELIATVLPANTTYPAVTWTSSSKETATVSSGGVVTGQNPGNVTITAYVTAYPDVKATYELEVTDLLLGDSNDNGIVTVADVVTTANHIISLPVASWSFVNADVTGDNEITTADVTGTVEIILNDVDFANARRARAYSAEYTSDCLIIDNYASGQTNATIGVRLDGSKPYSALQAILQVPEGLKVTDISAGPALSDHMILHNEAAPGMVKIIIFSLYNTEFNCDGLPLFYIHANTLLANGNIEMNNILGSDSDSNEYELSYTGGLLDNILTGIDDVTGPAVFIRAFVDGIEVINARGHEINVYRYTGETVASVRASEPVERILLEPGVYVVKAANVAAKVLVK